MVFNLVEVIVGVFVPAEDVRQNVLLLGKGEEFVQPVTAEPGHRRTDDDGIGVDRAERLVSSFPHLQVLVEAAAPEILVVRLVPDVPTDGEIMVANIFCLVLSVGFPGTAVAVITGPVVGFLVGGVFVRQFGFDSETKALKVGVVVGQVVDGVADGLEF